ncbi:hypothetical protein DPMN_145416 [Dreissena polymorpha]|uniref:Uncharacterized protein n=1 Tax=Dreissena polymorpha TaxID=45954 RepID=A0A9D4F5Y8_DREPO|nr:hypothetical protein DPMN_145416 [Dreissena polymorpha]
MSHNAGRTELVGRRKDFQWADYPCVYNDIIPLCELREGHMGVKEDVIWESQRRSYGGHIGSHMGVTEKVISEVKEVIWKVTKEVTEEVICEVTEQFMCKVT